MTATVNNWLPLFTRPQTVEILLDSWRFLQREGNLTLFGYVIPLAPKLRLGAYPRKLQLPGKRYPSWSLGTSAKVRSFPRAGVGAGRLFLVPKLQLGNAVPEAPASH